MSVMKTMAISRINLFVSPDGSYKIVSSDKKRTLTISCNAQSFKYILYIIEYGYTFLRYHLDLVSLRQTVEFNL